MVHRTDEEDGHFLEDGVCHLKNREDSRGTPWMYLTTLAAQQRAIMADAEQWSDITSWRISVAFKYWRHPEPSRSSKYSYDCGVSVKIKGLFQPEQGAPPEHEEQMKSFFTSSNSDTYWVQTINNDACSE